MEDESEEGKASNPKIEVSVLRTYLKIFLYVAPLLMSLVVPVYAAERAESKTLNVA